MSDEKLIEAVRQLGRAVELRETGHLTYGRRENKRRIRDAIEKAYWAVIDANTTAAREQQTREQEPAECPICHECPTCHGRKVVGGTFDGAYAQRCPDCGPAQPLCDCPHDHLGPCVPAQESVEDEETAMLYETQMALHEAAQARDKAIERAERAEREAAEARWLKEQIQIHQNRWRTPDYSCGKANDLLWSIVDTRPERWRENFAAADDENGEDLGVESDG